MSVLCFPGYVATCEVKSRVNLAAQADQEPFLALGTASCDHLVFLQLRGVYVAVCPQSQVWEIINIVNWLGCSLADQLCNGFGGLGWIPTHF